jgi:hypothetical protein
MATDSERKAIMRVCVTACHGLELPVNVEPGALKECVEVLTHLSKTMAAVLTKGTLRPATPKDEPIVGLLLGMTKLADQSLEKVGVTSSNPEPE